DRVGNLKVRIAGGALEEVVAHHQDAVDINHAAVVAGEAETDGIAGVAVVGNVDLTIPTGVDIVTPVEIRGIAGVIQETVIRDVLENDGPDELGTRRRSLICQ